MRSPPAVASRWGRSFHAKQYGFRPAVANPEEVRAEVAGLRVWIKSTSFEEYVPINSDPPSAIAQMAQIRRWPTLTLT